MRYDGEHQKICDSCSFGGVWFACIWAESTARSEIALLYGGTDGDAAEKAVR
jgi:hypothetical protein